MSPQPRIVVPQSDLFKSQASVALALTRHGRDPIALSRDTGISRRHVSYALQSLELLGFIDHRGSHSLAGQVLVARLLKGDSHIPDFRRAIGKSKTIQYLAPGIGTADFQLSRTQLASRIADLTGYRPATCFRRASTLLSWHRQLRQEQLPLKSPEQGQSPMQVTFIRKIGSGAYGDVWLGQDSLDRLVAVKFLNPDLARFHDLVQDAKALSRLDHDNVVRVYSVENLARPDNDAVPQAAVVMEYVDGDKLKSRLDAGLLSSEEVERIGTGLIAGLVAMHAAGVVHEDLHAENVLVSDHAVKIIDPHYQESLAADTTGTRQAKLSRDASSLKQLLQDLARVSAASPALWTQCAASIWQAPTLDDLQRAFDAYLVLVRSSSDARPERGDYLIPEPGGGKKAGYTEFVKALGFDSDPFFHTNAANEDRLPDYFVRPKYFRALQGDATRLESAVVFAPRGSGKTAQARMLGSHARETGVLPVIYECFPGLHQRDKTSPALDYHQANAARIGLTSVLLYMESRGIPFAALGGLENSIATAAYQLGKQLDRAEFIAALSCPFLAPDFRELVSAAQLESGKGPGDYIVKRWLELGLQVSPESDRDGSGAHAFAILEAAATTLKFKGVLVLVDRIDEADFAANHAERTYLLVESLVDHIGLQRESRSAWKIFVWDQAKTAFASRARTDRINHYELEWSRADMEAMLTARLRAFSSGQVSTLSDIAAPDATSAATFWPQVFAQNSPRNLIRLLQLTFRHEIEAGTSPPALTMAGLEDGISAFCRIHAKEVVPDQRNLRLLRRIGRTTFTAAQAANTLKMGMANARNKINALVPQGIVLQAGTIRQSQPGKPAKYYMIHSATVAAFCAQKTTVAAFVKDKLVECQACSGAFFTENEDRADDLLCPWCETPISTTAAETATSE